VKARPGGEVVMARSWAPVVEADQARAHDHHLGRPERDPPRCRLQAHCHSILGRPTRRLPPDRRARRPTTAHSFLGTHAPGCHAGGVQDVLERVPSRPRRHQGRRRQARDGILVAPPQCPSARSQRVPDEPRHHQLVGTAQHGSHTRSRPERGPPPLVVVVVHLCRAHRKLRDAAAFAMPRLQGRALAP
jgi:hypothetical protein